MKIYIVPGYGIPKDIFTNKTYAIYLKHVYDHVLINSTKYPKTKIIIIFSGGLTDILPPYKRTEAKEMYKYFTKTFGLNIKYIKYKLEQRSLSSLENQIYSKQIIDRIKSTNKNITIFGEKSRLARIRKTAKIIFPKISAVGITLPENKQVADKKLVNKKEKIVMEYSLWALKSEQNLKKFRRVFINKFRYLRKFPIDAQDEAVTKWWRDSIAKLNKNIVHE